ncbi:hypothetical protein CLV98_102291 [Dyadobacter jejuensis]|uniref:Uncharacterized protein n=2 Tax=Dyadobacter jejuensis TaxID=1082580 RepID=A0A316APR0_9BACT|nr:hypothetical protein CLV98_102291 [Dyadobacter jejuensis]
MALLVLISSTGFGFTEHHCTMQGKSVRYFSQEKSVATSKQTTASCCAKSKVIDSDCREFLKKADCCKVQQKFQKNELATPQAPPKALKGAVQMLPYAVATIHFLSALGHDPTQVPLRNRHAEIPYPYGKSMRIHVQSFLI